MAQQNPALRAAVELAQEGRRDSARRIIEAELRRARPGEAGYAEALFWRARLARTGDSAERDLRRVAIEHASSPWADDALLELAQMALVARNPASALALAERLRSDYPESELRSRAAYWAARAAMEAGDLASACARLDSARAEGARHVELLEQVELHGQRCPGIVTAVPSDSTRATHRPASGAAGTGTGGAWEVQVAATRSDRLARQVVERMERAGHRARVVTGTDGYRRVRIGPFPSELAAQEAARRARRIVGGAPFVVRP